jgi:uncharacterized protein (DUF2141 family)
LALSPISAPRAAATDDLTVDIQLSGLRNAKGAVLVCLTANPKAFPDCSKDSSATRAKVITGQAGHMRFAVPHSGSYAIAIIHDENGNGKLDTTMGMPKEGFGFSRNPTIMFGPPKFKAASFAVGEGANNQAVKLKYMF